MIAGQGSRAALRLFTALGIAGACALPATASPLAFSAGGNSLAAATLSSASAAGLGGVSVLRPRLDVSQEPLELRLEPRIRFGTEAGADLRIDELSLELKLGDALGIEAGRFTPLPGPAFLLSNVDYFAALDFERLIEEGPAHARLPDDLLRAQYDLGPWRFAASIAPFAPAYRDTLTSSPWLPLGGIKESFASALGTMTYKLRDLIWTEESSSRGFDPAYALEAGLGGEAWQLCISYYDGRDREPALIAMASSLDVSAFGYYDLELRHEGSRIRKVGLSGRMGQGSLSGWVDASWFSGRLLALGSPYSPVDAWQSSLSTEGITYTLGASLALPLPESSLELEWRSSSYFGDVSKASAPFLERAASARAAAYLPSGVAGIELLALYSLEDGSFLLVPAIKLRAAAGRTLSLDYLFFKGDSGTELGRFAASSRARLSLEVEL
jgi:hypothetical protein